MRLFPADPLTPNSAVFRKAQVFAAPFPPGVHYWVVVQIAGLKAELLAAGLPPGAQH
jgi:hypothetical protein